MSNDNYRPAESKRSIVKSASVLSVGTLTSRVLGFGRDVLLAWLIGTSFRAEAFFVALRIPNLFRSFVGEGATNSAVVPVLSEYLVTKKREDFWEFVRVIFGLALMILTALTAAGIVLSPWIVRIMAPGFMDYPHKLALTINLTRWMFPYLIFIGLVANAMAVLYAFRSFVVPAFSPCLFNLATIVSILVAGFFPGDPTYVLAVGVLIGGILQLVYHFIPLRKEGFRWQKPATFRHPGASQIGKLLVPRLFGAGIYQLNIFVDTFCASFSQFVGMGGISAITYASHLIQFPMGIFVTSLTTAVLPSMSELAVQKNTEELKKILVFSLENILFVMIPFGMILMVLAEPIVWVLFERGAFTAYSTAITSSALFYYAVGLVGFGGTRIMVTAFHARQDTKTPTKISAVCLGLNAVLNFALMVPFKIGGIALASSVTGIVSFFWLFVLMEKQVGSMAGPMKPFLAKIFSATACAAVITHMAWDYVPVPAAARVFLAAGIGALVYLGLCDFLHVEPARQLRHSLVRRVKRR